MPSAAPVVVALMVDFVDLGRIRVDSAYFVCDHSARFPGIPKLVADLHVLLELIVASSPLRQFSSVSLPLALGIRRDDVPRDPPGRQMIQAGKPT